MDRVTEPQNQPSGSVEGVVTEEVKEPARFEKEAPSAAYAPCGGRNCPTPDVLARRAVSLWHPSPDHKLWVNHGFALTDHRQRPIYQQF